MGRQEEIIKERLRKLHELKNNGIEPYPHKYEVKDKAADLQENIRLSRKALKLLQKCKSQEGL